MPRLMDRCEDVARLVSDGMDRELGWRERMRVRLHLLMCRRCSAFSSQVRILRDASRALGSHLAQRHRR